MAVHNLAPELGREVLWKIKDVIEQAGGLWVGEWKEGGVMPSHKIIKIFYIAALLQNYKTFPIVALTNRLPQERLFLSTC